MIGGVSTPLGTGPGSEEDPEAFSGDPGGASKRRPLDPGGTPAWAYVLIVTAVGLALGVFLLSESMKVDALLQVQVARSAPGNGWLPVRATLREGMAEGQWVPSTLPVVVELVAGQARVARAELTRNGFGEFEGELDLHKVVPGSYVLRAVSPLRAALLLERPFDVVAAATDAQTFPEQERRAMPTEVLRVERLHPARVSGGPNEASRDALRGLSFDGGACVPGTRCRGWLTLEAGWAPSTLEPETALQWKWLTSVVLASGEQLRPFEVQIEGPEGRVVLTLRAGDTGTNVATPDQSYSLWLPVALGSPHVQPVASRIAAGARADFLIRNELAADTVLVDGFLNGVWRRARSCRVRVGESSPCSVGPIDEPGTWLFQFYSGPTRTAEASSQRLLVVQDISSPAVAALDRDLAVTEGVTVDLPQARSTFAASTAELESTKRDVRLAVFVIIVCSGLFVVWHFWTRALEAARRSTRIERDDLDDSPSTNGRVAHVPLRKAVPLLLATLSIALALASALLVLLIRS